MPTDTLGYPNLLRGWFDVDAKDRVRPIRLRTVHGGSGIHPIVGPIVDGFHLPESKRLCQFRIEWNQFLRGFGFRWANSLFDDRTFDVDHAVLEIYIFPLKTQQFADA